MTAIRRATSDTFRSLRVRNFRLFFTGQLISQIGNWLTLVAQTLLVLKLTDNGVALGGLAVAQFGPVLLLGPWAGLIADRSDKRRLLLTVQTIAMAQSFVLAALAFSGHPSVSAIYAVALVGGITIAFDNPARRSFVVEMVPADDMQNAVSLNSALMTSSRVVGPALAGLLITTVPIIDGWVDTYEDKSVTRASDRELHFGQWDHVRYYGRDFRARVMGAGFHLSEFTGSGSDCVRYGLLPGESVFLGTKP